MKRYEGLFILNIAGKDEGVAEMIEKIKKDIEGAGGSVETTQKMEKKAFSRVADKKSNAGYYLNVIFKCPPSALNELHRRFTAMKSDIFRVLFTESPELKEVPAGAAR